MIRTIFILLAMVGIVSGQCFHQQFVPVQAVQTVQHVVHAPVRVAATAVQHSNVLHTNAQEISYLVGQQVRLQALIRAELEATSEYQELQQFRAWKAAQQTPSKPAAKAVQNQRVQGITLATTCAKCHSGENPAAGIPLDGSVPIAAGVVARTVEMMVDPSTAPDKMQPIMSSMQEDQKRKLLADLTQLWNP